MTPAGNYSPAETTIELGGGSYLCRLPVHLAAELQNTRGEVVTFPDGATARRAKPLGLIWREHCETGEYNPVDSVAVITLALIGGAAGADADKNPVVVTRPIAEGLVRDYVTGRPGEVPPMGAEHIWQLAMKILIAVCQGYTEPGGGKAPGAAADTPMSTSPSSSGTVSSGASPSETPET